MTYIDTDGVETLSQFGRGSRTAVTPYAPLKIPSFLKRAPSPTVPTPEPIAPALPMSAIPDTALDYGVGIDDSPEGSEDAAHTSWLAMMKRVYPKDPTNPYPTYDGCSVDLCWHLYSDFKRWFDVNHIAGYQLDKDILQPGNRLYSPDTCVFVPAYINQTVRWRRKMPKSGFPGVKAFAGLWYASIMHKGVLTDYESRKDALEAHCDWQRMKADTVDDHLHNYLQEVAPDLRVVRALIRYADMLRSNADQGVPTFKYQH
ncbi:hypothetical protein [Pseudomonas fluorescens]|uniref:hypothetical protein n=1 Tax=Pseudomonas fluorescens TaxID=294 RepID=UPI0012D32DD5|nr:hypothetical protein [Pseudomonas fluorescens]